MTSADMRRNPLPPPEIASSSRQVGTPRNDEWGSALPFRVARHEAQCLTFHNSPSPSDPSASLRTCLKRGAAEVTCPGLSYPKGILRDVRPDCIGTRNDKWGA